MTNDNLFRAAEPRKRSPELSIRWRSRAGALFIGITALSYSSVGAQAADPPRVFDPNLGVRSVVEGLPGPTSIAFLTNDNIDVDFDMLVLQRKGTVLRVVRDRPRAGKKWACCT
jgi:hypothetical protein